MASNSCHWIINGGDCESRTENISSSSQLIILRRLASNMHKVVFGSHLYLLYPAVPLAVMAEYYGFGRPWIFALSLLGLTPLAERLSFLTEQIAVYTGQTVGGLLNATCGNVPELIIAVLALKQKKISVVKYSLLGSILSNLLLVLGTSLFCGGLASNRHKEQKFDRKKANVNSLMLLLALLCHMLPMLLIHGGSFQPDVAANMALTLSRVSSVGMLVAYVGYLLFQLVTHRELYAADEEIEEDDGVYMDEATIGFYSAFAWTTGVTGLIALLSQFVVNTIEVASETWGVSIPFISIILLPISSNAPEHASAVVFAFKNKLDISLGVALGSATQIAMLVVPIIVIISWIMENEMNLNLGIIETCILASSVLISAFAVQDGVSNYMKGLALVLFYFIISACFFILKSGQSTPNDGMENKAISRMLRFY